MLSVGTLPPAVGGREGNHLRRGPSACHSKERGHAEGASRIPQSMDGDVGSPALKRKSSTVLYN